MDLHLLNRPQKIDIYGQAAEWLAAALKRYPKKMWQHRSGVEDWTIQEIIIHITDSEATSYVRCRRFVAEPGLPLMAYDENRWARELNYLAMDVETAVSLFTWLRQSSFQLIQSLPDTVWQHEAFHPENGPMTLENWLDTYARHVPDHIAQMDRIFEAWQQEQPA